MSSGPDLTIAIWTWALVLLLLHVLTSGCHLPIYLTPRIDNCDISCPAPILPEFISCFRPCDLLTYWLIPAAGGQRLFFLLCPILLQSPFLEWASSVDTDNSSVKEILMDPNNQAQTVCSDGLTCELQAGIEGPGLLQLCKLHLSCSHWTLIFIWWVGVQKNERANQRGAPVEVH